MLRSFLRTILFILSVYFISCSPENGTFFELQLPTADNKTVNLSETKNNRASVFVFLNPDCPLSQKYSLSIKNIFAEYSGKNIPVYLVFPGRLYSNSEIKKFLSDYNLQMVAIEDEDKKLTACLGAEITPEAFLIDAKGNFLYKGAIDNWFMDVDQKREVITEHYLADAIQLFLAGKTIKVSQTKPVGCIIE